MEDTNLVCVQQWDVASSIINFVGCGPFSQLRLCIMSRSPLTCGNEVFERLLHKRNNGWFAQEACDWRQVPEVSVIAWVVAVVFRVGAPLVTNARHK